MIEWIWSLPALIWAGVVALVGYALLVLSRKLGTIVLSAVGLDRADAKIREIIEVNLLRKPLYSAWTLTPAADNEIDYVREHLNLYLAPSERHLDNSSLERFRNVRRDDYLILRGPVEESSIDARYGVAIIHPLLNDDGRKFETGAKTGTDLTPKMIKSGKLARYVYISFAKADDGKAEILAEKIVQNIRLRTEGRMCIIARPTTDKALKILTRRGFKRCRPSGTQIEVRQTCFKWINEPA